VSLALADDGMPVSAAALGPSAAGLAAPFARSGPQDATPWPAGQSLRSVERATLLAQLQAHQGSRAALAQQLGISERSLYRKLRLLRDDTAPPDR
jgi:DNA-binding NtrC family response regulator